MLCFLYGRKGRKNSPLNYQKDKTTPRDALSGLNFTDTINNDNESAISVIQF